MKKNIKIPAFIFIMSLIFACGENTSTENKTEEGTKINKADLFKDDRPVYNAKAIDANAPIQEVNLAANGNTMAEMKYDQKEIVVKSGTTVRLTFKNNSTDAAMPHNWVLVYDGTMESVATAGISAGKAANFVPESKDVLVSTKLLGPGEEVSIEFPAPPAGKYQFVCTYPGHWSTMNGVFVVE